MDYITFGLAMAAGACIYKIYKKYIQRDNAPQGGLERAVLATPYGSITQRELPAEYMAAPSRIERIAVQESPAEYAAAPGKVEGIASQEYPTAAAKPKKAEEKKED